MRIIVINQPIYNRGDESAHRCLINNLSNSFPNSKITVLFDIGKWESIKNIIVHKSNVEYIVICNEKKIPSEYGIIEKIRWKVNRIIAYQAIKFNSYKFASYLPIYRTYIEHIKTADLIINAPGGIDLGGFKNWNDLFRLNICKAYKKKIAYYSRSIGPYTRKNYKEKLFAERCISFLKSVNFLSLRDRKSISIAEQENIPYIPSVDTAFLSVPDTIMPKEIKDYIGTDYIVMVPNQLTWHFNYRAQPQEYIDTFYKNICTVLFEYFPNHNIVMIPQLYAYGSKGDYPYFTKLAQGIKDKRIKIINDKYSSDVQQSIIKNSKLVIGARYHTIIWAINNCRPFVSLSYEHKMTGILQELDASKHSFNLEKCILEKWNPDKYLPIIKNLLTIAENNTILQEKAASKAIKCYNTFIKTI